MRSDKNNCDDISIDDKSLYEYVLEQEELENLINKVGPEYPNTFGSLEGFGDADNKLSGLYCIICIVIIALLIILFTSKCRDGGKPSYMNKPDMNNFTAVFAK